MKETTEKLEMGLANRTLQTVLLDFEKHKIKIANLMKPDVVTCSSSHQEKLTLCCNTLVADCRQRKENHQRPEYSEQHFLEYCHLPHTVGGTICDMAAMLAYKELYEVPGITPFFISFRCPLINNRPETAHAAVGIFHSISQPEPGIFNFQESIETLGEDIHIIDPWLGFSCRAFDYPHFMRTAIQHLNCNKYKLILHNRKQVFLSPVVNFIDMAKAVELTHLPTLENPSQLEVIYSSS